MSITPSLPSLKSLGFPRKMSAVRSLESGLVLIAGPAGSGRSTTLSAVGRELKDNQGRKVLFVNMEDFDDPMFSDFDTLKVEPWRPVARTENATKEEKKAYVAVDKVNMDAWYRSVAPKISATDPDVILFDGPITPTAVKLMLDLADAGYLVIPTFYSSSIETVPYHFHYFLFLEPAYHSRQIANTLKMVSYQKMVRKSSASPSIPKAEVFVPDAKFLEKFRTISDS